MEKDLDITKPCYNREQILIFASPLALLYIEVPERTMKAVEFFAWLYQYMYFCSILKVFVLN